MFKLRHSAHRRRDSTILNRYRNGYRIPTIAHELGISRYHVAAVIHASGVSYLSLSMRDRKTVNRRQKPGRVGGIATRQTNT